MSTADERLENLSILWRRRRDHRRGADAGVSQDPSPAGGVFDLDLTTAQAYIASLHLAPGEPVPEAFEQCPVCAGAGCGDCDARGWVHPVLGEWLEDLLLGLLGTLHVIATILARPDLPAPARRQHEWLSAQADAAERLLDDWASASPDLAKVIAAAGWRRLDAEDLT